MKVAFSRVKITPKDYIGKALAGYTRKDPCLGKIDDIFAYGVLIQQKSSTETEKNILLISIDMLKFSLAITNYIKLKIKTEIKSLNSEQILIHATHTHSSPDLTGEFHWPGGTLNLIRGIMFGANRNDKYIVWMTRNIIKMVKQLYRDLEPCKMAWMKKKIEKDIIINRRHPTWRSKSELGVIAFRNSKSNKLMGIIVNFACHPTTLSKFNNKLSADYPGRIIYKIHKISKNQIKAIFFNGPAGDINPITTCGTDFEKLENNKGLIYGQLGTYKNTRNLGYFLGEEALKLAESIPNDLYFDKLEINYYLKEFWVYMKDYKYFSKTWLINKLYFLLKKYLLMPIAIISGKNPNFPVFSIKTKFLNIKCKTFIQFIQIKVNSGSKFKYLGIMTVPGELFERIGKNLLKESPTGNDNSFIFQDSNDWIAYLFPIIEYIKEGGYEPIPSFSPLSGYFVEKEMLKLFEEIKLEKP
jgi:hypothetical protein